MKKQRITVYMVIFVCKEGLYLRFMKGVSGASSFKSVSTFSATRESSGQNIEDYVALCSFSVCIHNVKKMTV